MPTGEGYSQGSSGGSGTVTTGTQAETRSSPPADSSRGEGVCPEAEGARAERESDKDKDNDKEAVARTEKEKEDPTKAGEHRCPSDDGRRGNERRTMVLISVKVQKVPASLAPSAVALERVVMEAIPHQPSWQPVAINDRHVLRKHQERNALASISWSIKEPRIKVGDAVIVKDRYLEATLTTVRSGTLDNGSSAWHHDND
ncbi:hypothetical protein NDU88_001665 [Pleurodeles waltl]|uniref:Uncharacterized protein n=1 Tax=Pleurodeles waltl TaxID=8319 RepID=A0AAV7SZV6_PLEWA|nr:hypothetical protein NDU88_001665 [Pleurodeles waltl]